MGDFGVHTYITYLTFEESPIGQDKSRGRGHVILLSLLPSLSRQRQGNICPGDYPWSNRVDGRV